MPPTWTHILSYKPPNLGTEARLPYLLTNVAGGFAVTLVRNKTQRHSAALKNAGQNPVGLLPLDKFKYMKLHLVCFRKQNIRKIVNILPVIFGC